MESNDQGRVSIDPKVIKQDRELQIKNLAMTSGTSLPKGCRKLISVDVLDKIRAEILGISSYEGFELGGVKDGYRIAMVNVLDIIDKYRQKVRDKE